MVSTEGFAGSAAAVGAAGGMDFGASGGTDWGAGGGVLCFGAAARSSMMSSRETCWVASGLRGVVPGLRSGSAATGSGSGSGSGSTLGFMLGGRAGCMLGGRAGPAAGMPNTVDECERGPPTGPAASPLCSSGGRKGSSSWRTAVAEKGRWRGSRESRVWWSSRMGSGSAVGAAGSSSPRWAASTASTSPSCGTEPVTISWRTTPRA